MKRKIVLKRCKEKKKEKKSAIVFKRNKKREN